MKIRCGIALLALLLFVPDLNGQSTGRRRPARRPNETAPPRGAAVRAELAAMLLESGKYREAAREYRKLIETNSRNSAYRFGLVRALAWDERYREAARELKVLATQRKDDPEVEELQRLVRANLEPTSVEARQWVLERPYYDPYRLALARALVRERQPRPAIIEFDAVMATSPTASLVGEIAHAYVSAGDRVGGVAYVSGTVARAPADTGFRRVLEELRVADRQYSAAIAQSDTIIMLARTPGTLSARARVNAARGDLRAAERDLKASIAIHPTAEAFLLLGDTHRWRGKFDRARSAYESARTLKPDTSISAAFAQLARDEHAVLALEPEPVAAKEWETRALINSDNAGVQYSTIEFRRSFGLAYGFAGGASVKGRQLRGNSAPLVGAVSGYGADLEIAREGIRGPFFGRAGVSGGFIFHPSAKTVGAASLALTGRYYAWSASYDLSTGPAYPLLRTLASMMPLGAGTMPLTIVTHGGSLGGPVGRFDIALGLRSGAISDGNHRTEIQGYGRLPLVAALSAVYWGDAIGFTRPSSRYWSPRSYVASALGLELGTSQLRGWWLTTRALPGVAATDDSPFSVTAISDTATRRLRFQMNAGGEIGYRHPRWESAISFGWAKVANYTRTETSARITLSP